uniref:MATE family efflux transporter n=1 Tax=Gemmiger formicilis TaxID=745368 RepID=UPI00402977A5
AFGAAFATVFSQAVAGIGSLLYILRHYHELRWSKDEGAFSLPHCAKLCSMGIPMGLQCSITAIGSVIMQWAVNVLGSTAVAAVTAAGKTQGLLTVPMESVGTAMATYAGQNLGASRMDRVRQGVNSAMLIILIYGVASAFVLHFTDVQIMSLFLDTAKEVDIVAMGREYLFWNSVFFVPLGALIIWRYTIQGLGFSSLAMLAGVAEMVARTAVAIVLVPVLGYFGAELSNPAAWIAACLFLYPAYRWTCRQLDNRLLTARLHIQGDHAETVL